MRRSLVPVVAFSLAAAVCAAPKPLYAAAAGFDPALARYVELTHPFGPNTIYWPTAPAGFGYVPLARGQQPGGWFYSAGAFSAPEHGGTHVDAPVHFKEGAASIDQVPLSKLIVPLCVMDVSAGAAANPDYEITPMDIFAYETRNGPIPKGCAVVAHTGWSRRWGDKREYLGDDTPGQTDNLHFPGFGEEAMKLLVQKGVAAVGLDTASLDPGKSTEFLAHRVAAAAGIPGFENLTNLDQVPQRGAWILALPMLIEGGTGAPLRAVAMVPPGK